MEGGEKRGSDRCGGSCVSSMGGRVEGGGRKNHFRKKLIFEQIEILLEDVTAVGPLLWRVCQNSD